MALTLTEIQRRTLAILEARIEQVALLPSVVAMLSGLDFDSVDATAQIEALACSDPPLALRLLRLANAGGIADQNFATIGEAINQVGTRRLADMIVALHVVKVFVPQTQAQRNLWIHSIQTALASSRIADLHPELGVSPKEAYLAGLLHDIGRFMIFEHRPQDMAQIDEALVADPRDLVNAEIRVCGFDHATLGHVICERLLLPFTVSEMVRTHHFYHDKRSQIAPEVQKLVRLVQEADCVSFGLLRRKVRHSQFDLTRDEWIAQALRLVATPDEHLSPERWAKEIQNIDRDTHIATELVEITYSDELN